MLADLSRVLYHESTILSRLDELAHQITWDYRDKELTVVAVLNGSFMFLGDLLRRIPIPLHVDCLSVSSYSGHRSTGVVTFDQTNMPEITGRHVLVVDDILDGGFTLHAVRERLLQLNPVSLKIGVLLRKNRVREKPVEGGLRRVRYRGRICRWLRAGFHGALPQPAVHRRARREMSSRWVWRS